MYVTSCVSGKMVCRLCYESSDNDFEIAAERKPTLVRKSKKIALKQPKLPRLTSTRKECLLWHNSIRNCMRTNTRKLRNVSPTNKLSMLSHAYGKLCARLS